MPEQIQQMYNLDDKQATIKILVVDMYNGLIRTNSDDATDHFNL